MPETLYERLGGEDNIARIVNDAIDEHLNNPLVKTRFENAADIEDSRRKAIEFFCAGAGGPQTYTGRDMRTAHTGMNVSEQEFIAVVDDILLALDKNEVGEQERKDVLAILYSLKGEIVRL